MKETEPKLEPEKKNNNTWTLSRLVLEFAAFLLCLSIYSPVRLRKRRVSEVELDKCFMYGLASEGPLLQNAGFASTPTAVSWPGQQPPASCQSRPVSGWT
jgi:hypothetical protein